MKRIYLLAFVATLCLTLPFSALAAEMDHSMGQMEGMDHGKMQGMDHGKMEGMDHGKMKMMNGMMMLGNETEDGVTAMAHIKDIHEGMAKMGMDQTHHFMIMFTDKATGKPISDGTVALKIKGPSGDLGNPVQLMGMKMGMGAGFGSDITLPQKGQYEFIVGTKLQDGKKRQFHFEFDNK